MWLGTANGLNRYDGKRIKQFFNDPKKKNSLLYNRISSLAIDNKNRVWIYSAGGVSCYDQYSDSFIHYNYNNDKNSLPKNSVTNLYLSEDNKVWISTLKGFYVVDDKMALQKQEL